MLIGSLNSPSLFWLDAGDPGADCSVLSSGCSWDNSTKYNEYNSYSSLLSLYFLFLKHL